MDLVIINTEQIIELVIIGFNPSVVESVTAGTNVTITGTATNPIINSTGGGSSYLSYVAALSQDNLGTYSCVPYEDTIGITSITNNGLNTAKINSAGSFTVGKTVYPPFGDWNGNANVYLPISDGSAILGYYTVSYNLNAVFVDFLDSTFSAATLFSLVGSTSIFIEIRVYP